MASFTKFDTRTEANEGVKLPLFDLEGNETNEWIVVLGVDSDAFIQARDKLNRLAVLDEANINIVSMLKQSIGDMSGDDRKEAERHIGVIESIVRNAVPDSDRKRELRAALIKNWSFDESCTQDNKIKFLRDAPHLADLIDQKAADRKAFIQKKSKP